MVTLTFTGTPSEIHAEMKEMLNHIANSVGTKAILAANGLGEGPTKTRTEIEQRVEEANARIAAATAEPAAEPEKKRTRRTKAEMAEARAQEPIETKQHDTKAEEPATAPSQNAAAPVVNKEAVHAALQQVNVAVGLPKAREILTHFKVNRMSELKPEDYKPFIEKCNEAVMMA